MNPQYTNVKVDSLIPYESGQPVGKLRYSRTFSALLESMSFLFSRVGTWNFFFVPGQERCIFQGASPSTSIFFFPSWKGRKIADCFIFLWQKISTIQQIPYLVPRLQFGPKKTPKATKTTSENVAAGFSPWQP